MQRRSNEVCFIAWGGNQSLAKAVGNNLEEKGFSSIVGGGQVTDMYLGDQIIKQMNQSSHAIILVQGASNDGKRCNFNDNMMFEWGYLTGKMQPNKIHVFLIDVGLNHLPSDLMGIWATEVVTQDKTEGEIAEEIGRIFIANASVPLDIKKMEVLHTWSKTKLLMKNYNTSPEVSDLELAHRILHSIEVSYQYMEDEQTLAMLDEMRPISTLLKEVMQIARVSIVLVAETNHLTVPLEYDLYEELKSICEKISDFSETDENLDLWIRFYKYDQLTMLNSSIATNEDMSEEEKVYYINESLKTANEALKILDEISTKYPRDKVYAGLFYAYIHGHIRYHCYNEINDVEDAAVHSRIAVAAFKDFYLAYKQEYPTDEYLNNQFAQAYYLDLARHCDYVVDPGERLRIKRSLSSFLQKRTKQEEYRHKVYQKLKAKVEKILNN